MIEDNEKLLAYDDVTSVVRGLLAKHPGAKIYVTGHSLGGALAALYTGMLHYNGETEIVSKIAAVYTFGQPRVGDEKFAKYMMQHLTDSRYFRVVYCNDLVPRVPFDDELFAFKHFGLCFYYNSRYKGRVRCLQILILNPDLDRIAMFLHPLDSPLFGFICAVFEGGASEELLLPVRHLDGAYHSDGRAHQRRPACGSGVC